MLNKPTMPSGDASVILVLTTGIHWPFQQFFFSELLELLVILKILLESIAVP